MKTSRRSAFSASEQCHWLQKTVLIPDRLSSMAVSTDFSSVSTSCLKEASKSFYKLPVLYKYLPLYIYCRSLLTFSARPVWTGARSCCLSAFGRRASPSDSLQQTNVHVGEQNTNTKTCVASLTFERQRSDLGRRNVGEEVLHAVKHEGRTLRHVNLKFTNAEIEQKESINKPCKYSYLYEGFLTWQSVRRRRLPASAA